MSWAAIDPDGLLAIGAPKSEYHLAQQVPGANYSKKDQLWRLPLSWPGYTAVRTVWSGQQLTESPQLQAWAAAAWKDVQLAWSLRSTLDAPDFIGRQLDDIESSICDPDGKDARRLFVPQRGGAAWLALQGRTILADPMGNGKTPQVIRALQLLKERASDSEEQPFPALVICVGAAVFNWQREFACWAPELDVRTVTGTALRRRQALADEGEADVYVISWPNLRAHTRLAGYGSEKLRGCSEHGGAGEVTPALCEKHEKELNQIPFRAVIADEAHRLANPKAKQTRAAWWLMHRSRYAFAVTGTPVTGNVGGFWGIAHALDPKGFPARSRYIDLYATVNHLWNGGAEVLGLRPDTEPAFHVITQPMMRRIPKEIARPFQPARLPPVFRYPEMTPPQARAYKALRKEQLAELDGAEIVPDNAAVRFGRLCQLASSMIELRDGEDDDGFTRQEVRMVSPSGKVDDLLDFLTEDEPGCRLVVACWSPQLVELAATELGKHKITHTRIVGGMNEHQKDQAAEWFQNGDSQVIFITDAGSESITLTAASTIFFLQPDPSFLSREQKIGRIDRIGQSDAVKVIYSISRGTTDERLFELGDQKQERAGQVTRDPDLMRWILQGDDHESATAEV